MPVHQPEVQEEEQDFIACASAACEKFSHKGHKAEYYVDLPLSNVEALAIRVHASKQMVVPRIFSRTLLPFTSIPADFRDEKRLNVLLT